MVLSYSKNWWILCYSWSQDWLPWSPTARHSQPPRTVLSRFGRPEEISENSYPSTIGSSRAGTDNEGDLRISSSTIVRTVCELFVVTLSNTTYHYPYMSVPETVVFRLVDHPDFLLIDLSIVYPTTDNTILSTFDPKLHTLNPTPFSSGKRRPRPKGLLYCHCRVDRGFPRVVQYLFLTLPNSPPSRPLSRKTSYPQHFK